MIPLALFAIGYFPRRYRTVIINEDSGRLNSSSYQVHFDAKCSMKIARGGFLLPVCTFHRLT